MFCVDWNGERKIFGNERNENNLRMDIVFVPCNYLHQLDGGYEDSVHPECIWDKDE